jgi:hypothetical protein
LAQNEDDTGHTHIMAYPKELTGSEISEGVRALVRELAGQLLAGDTDVHVALRKQLATAQIARVTLTGTGLYADLSTQPDAPLADRDELIGGEVLVNIEGFDVPAGSLLKVTKGRLALSRSPPMEASVGLIIRKASRLASARHCEGRVGCDAASTFASRGMSDGRVPR